MTGFYASCFHTCFVMYTTKLNFRTYSSDKRVGLEIHIRISIVKDAVFSSPV